MNTLSSLHLGLEDLIAELRHARRHGDLGRLALIAYCEVRRWARQAGETELAEHSTLLITRSPHSSREAFVAAIDDLIHELEQLLPRFAPQSAAAPAPSPMPAPSNAH